MRTTQVSRIAEPLPVIGQGTWNMGLNRKSAAAIKDEPRHATLGEGSWCAQKAGL